MQWSLAGAKRLECGSLLPLCFYAQTTCLEPDRHDAENNVSVPISPHPISPLIAMASHALPPMQWALAGAKRLECGSLLPLCFYAQTTCLEPDRHDAENNVSVPISASEGFLHRLRQPRIGTRDSSRATPQSGRKTQTTSLSPYPTRSHRPYRRDRITDCKRSRYRERDQTRSLKVFANMKDFSIS